MNASTEPLDQTSVAALAADGLAYRQVDAADLDDYTAWFQAESRGFLSPRLSHEVIAARQTMLEGQRLIGVYDHTIADPTEPVATTICWPADLTVPGKTSVPSWAISGVTVAPTHRRRGIARALIGAELRDAARLGLPLAMLTVSESTIYARFGFAPAAFARDVTVQTRRARWTGPSPRGRVQFVSAEQLRVDGAAVVERVRLGRPGEMTYSPDGALWLRQLGLVTGDDNAKNLRFIRYDDADGTAQGFAIYQLVENESDFAEHELKLAGLVAATDDAYAGLWRFLIELDLVSKISAHLRPVDEPLRWMINDFRAVQISEFDHLWIRVLDVPAALSARSYTGPERLVVTVTDPDGFADGTWTLDVDGSGQATVTPSQDEADVTMSVNALGSLYLGGVPARQLIAAGSLVGDAERLDRLFRSPVEPFLSIWF